MHCRPDLLEQANVDERSDGFIIIWDHWPRMQLKSSSDSSVLQRQTTQPRRCKTNWRAAPFGLDR
jgi:hypothetical protein